VRLPARGSLTETLLTTTVGSAAVIVWINELLGDGPLGTIGVVLVCVAAGWVWWQRNRTPPQPERPLLVAGTVALVLGIAFQLLSNRF
jgi:uncharacterized iron-regulated membrane protein